MHKSIPLAVLALGLALASAASADVIIRVKETRDLDAKRPTVSTETMTFNASCMATRSEGGEPGHGRLIFRGDRQLMWVVNDGKRSYQQIDKASMDQMAAQVTDARSQMQAQLEKMPPEQRAQAEAMMKKYNGAAANAGAPSRIEYRRTGDTRVIDGKSCTKYEAYWGKDLIAYDWVAPYSAMKLTESDGAVFKQMADFVSTMTRALGQVQKQDYIPMHELGGIPLLAQQVEDGKITSESQVESVTHDPAPPGSFDLPSGYKLEPMPMGPHHR